MTSDRRIRFCAGWFEQEYQAYGYPFPPVKQRLAHVARGARQLRRPALHGGGEKVLLKLAARYASGAIRRRSSVAGSGRC